MGRSRGRDFRLLLAATFFYGTGPTAVVPLIAGYAGELGASGVFMGIAGGLMNIVSLASRPFVGNLADRVGKRRLTICGGALMVLAGLAYTLAYLPWMVLAARVFHGIGFACCSVSLSTWISNLLPRDRVASGVGLYGMMTAVGMAIGPAAGIWLYQHAGYHVAFLVAAALMAGMVVLSFCVRDEGLVVDDGARKGHFRLIEWRVVPVTLVAMLFAIPYVATQAFIVPVAEAEGVTAPVALYFPIYAIVLVVLRLGLRRCFDRLPFYVFLFASLVCAALSLLCLSWMQGFWVMFLAAAFMAGAHGVMFTVCQSTALLLVNPGERGLANGTFYIGIDIGMALGPVLGGFFFAHLPLGAFYLAFLSTLFFILAVYGLWWCKGGRRSHQE